MRIFLTKLLILITLINHAQTLTPIVISTSGANFSTSQVSLSVTIGELTAIETVSNNSINLILTQGFQQNHNIVALPLKLIDFKNIKVGNSNQLKWSVISEFNINSYYVQSSIDGINFRNIDTILAKNNNQKQTSYSVIDKDINFGNNYYRLQINESNGSKWYSWVIKVNENEKNIKLYPMPLSNTLFIELYQQKRELKELKLMDIVGKTIWTKSFYFEKGLNNIQIDFSKQNSGTYLLIGLDNKGIQLIKN